MKLISAFLLIILANAAFCIQYGTNVLDIRQYPYYIMIGNPHICGGSLLSYDPPLVLTAAHCVADAGTKPSDYTKEKNPFFANYYNVHREKQKSIGIADWTVHPLYNVSSVVNMNYDVAIVQLDTPLRKSSRVKRVALWSPLMNSTLPTRGELIGFGFTNLNGQEAKQLQRLQLDITRFNPNGFYNVEARSDTEEHIACHGDSGSPLVTHRTVESPRTHKNITVPFVVGNLARIFGAHDLSPNKLTCPIPHETSNNHGYNSSLNTVTESFCNTASMIDWVSSTTGISVANLTDPFYNPPHPPCIHCKKKSDSKNNTAKDESESDDDDDDDEEDDDMDEEDEEYNILGSKEEEKHQWHIGVAADENGLLDTNHTDAGHIWIGGLGQDFLLKANPDESNSLSSFNHIQRCTFVFSTALLLIIIIIFIHH